MFLSKNIQEKQKHHKQPALFGGDGESLDQFEEPNGEENDPVRSFERWPRFFSSKLHFEAETFTFSGDELDEFEENETDPSFDSFGAEIPSFPMF